MAEQNERLAVLETKVEKLQAQLEAALDMRATLETLVRQRQRFSNRFETEEFMKDTIWLRQSRESSERLAGKVKLTIAAALTAATLSMIWYGLLRLIDSGLGKS